MTDNAAISNRPDRVEEMFDVKVPQGSDKELAYYMAELNWYREAFETEPPRVTATITKAALSENGLAGKEIWMQFVTDTGRAIERSFRRPTMDDTPETNRFLQLLKLTGTSPADPLQIIGKKVPIFYDEVEDSVDVLIPLPEEERERSLDRITSSSYLKRTLRSVLNITADAAAVVWTKADHFLRLYPVSVKLIWLLTILIFLLGGRAAAAGHPSLVTVTQGAIGAIVTTVLGALYLDAYVID